MNAAQPRRPLPLLSLAALAIASVALSAGCRAKEEATLAGEWSGDADCGEGATGVTMRLVLAEDNPQSYSGSGEVLGLRLDGEGAEVGMNIEVEQPEADGAQTVEVSAVCAIYVGEASEAVDCSGFTELGWDGADLLGADFADFFGSGLTCALELSR